MFCCNATFKSEVEDRETKTMETKQIIMQATSDIAHTFFEVNIPF